jgi:hypothetical protein
MIHYIRGDGDKAFGTIVTFEDADDDVPHNVDKSQRRIVNARRTQPKSSDIQLGNQRFVRNNFTTWLQNAHRGEGVELFLDPSPFTNKIRTVDRVIRTIRDMVGENQDLLADPEFMQPCVDIYNNTPHTAFVTELSTFDTPGFAYTPLQVQLNPDLEEYFIRENMSRLKEVKDLQREAGFFNYRKGNVLLIHLNKAKTNEMFDKKRRAFNEVAIFVAYQNGNVVCLRLTRRGGQVQSLSPTPILLPIYHTKFIANSLDELPQRFQQLIF